MCWTALPARRRSLCAILYIFDYRIYFVGEVFDDLSEILVVHVLFFVERIDIFHRVVLFGAYSKISCRIIDDGAGLVVGASVNKISIIIYCYGEIAFPFSTIRRT